MGKLVVCPKKTGNTYQVCNYLKRNIDIDLKIIGDDNSYNLNEYEKVILASGVYGGNPHQKLMDWLEGLKEEKIQDAEFYIFMTWFGRADSDKETKEKVASKLKEKGAKLEDDYVTVYGQKLLIIRYGHPNQKELNEVLNWVKKL